MYTHTHTEYIQDFTIEINMYVCIYVCEYVYIPLFQLLICVDGGKIVKQFLFFNSLVLFLMSGKRVILNKDGI